MTKQDVKVGETYVMRHTSGRIRVRILREVARQSYGGYSGTSRNMTHWKALNLKTQREIEIKSAARLSPLPVAAG